MITATCRTCHQDWTLAQLPAPIIGIFTVTTAVEAPCGHGRLFGRLITTLPVLMGFMGQLADSGPDPDYYQWEWEDSAYDAAMQAVRSYDATHPAPRSEPWDPPTLSLTCLCGERLTLQGVDDEDLDEEWRGSCDHCGFTVWVSDAGQTVSYAQERQQRFDHAYAQWEAHRPQEPQLLRVDRLHETAESDE